MLTPLSAFLKAVESQPHRAYLRQPENGEYREITWLEVHDLARNVAYQLTQLGVEKGDRIALWSKNCAEWIISDLAIMMVGAVSVPLYPGQSKENVHYVLEHSEAKFIFVGKHDCDQDVINSLPESPPSIGYKYFSGVTQYQWDTLAAIPAPDSYSINQPTLDDIMTIVYTSGTTGQPKGAVHSYRAFAFTSNNFVEQLDITVNDRTMSFLPLAHVAERILVEGLSYYAWFTISFVESLDSFNENLVSVKPTLFFAVPRLWAKFQEGILGKIGSDEKLQKLIGIPFIGWYIKHKIRKALGLDQARLLGCGASPMPKALIEWYQTLGMTVLEGYGMTENLIFGTINKPKDKRIGSVGKPFERNHLKIGQDGEILFKSDSVMLEYYKSAGKTQEAMIDGYYRTGDKGYIDPQGFLHITGRIKELFKTSKGKYVAPAPLEALLSSHPFIEQACVTGSGLSQPVGVLELSETARSKNKSDVASSIQKHIEQLNQSVEHHERIEKVILTQVSWTIESELITPTLKIRREKIEEQFLDALLSDTSGVAVIWGPDVEEGSTESQAA